MTLVLDDSSSEVLLSGQGIVRRAAQGQVGGVVLATLSEGLQMMKLQVASLAATRAPFIHDGCAPKWDGKNEKGQRVGSGIYYYRLTVSGRDTSRRMVVLR